VNKNVTPGSVVFAENNKMIEEIDASALMQDELRRTDPNLASASSFLSVLTGGTKRKRSVKESENVTVTETETKVVSTKLAVVQPPSVRYLEKQRTTRIVAAESLLRDELKKINPSMTSVAAFRKAAYGDESLETTDLGARRMIEQEVTTETELVLEEDGHKLKAQAGECHEAELVMSDDAEMSFGDSDEKETGSNGFSGGYASSSDGESVVNRGSRKRPAAESPDQELAETTRKEFPGTMTRSDAGCRIYVPPPEKEEEKGTPTPGVKIAATTAVECVGTTAVEGVGTKGAEGVETTGVEGVTTPTEWNMPASTLFTEPIGGLDAIATTVMTVAGVGTSIDMIPPTSVLTTEGTSTGARWATASMTIASQAAVLLIDPVAVVDFAMAENTDMPNVTGMCETTVPAMNLESISGPQAVTVELVEIGQSTAPAHDPRPEPVVVASELETAATMMPANTQAILL